MYKGAKDTKTIDICHSPVLDLSVRRIPSVLPLEALAFFNLPCNEWRTSPTQANHQSRVEQTHSEQHRTAYR